FINSNIPDALEDAYAVAWFLSLGSLPGGPDLRDDLDAVANAVIDALSFAAVPIEELVAKTQNLNLQQQLDEGVRVLDIRVEQTPDQFEIVHGDLPIGTPTLMFDSAVLQVATDFLAEHPTETIVMQVQVDNNNGTENAQTVDETFHGYESEVNPDTGLPY